MASPPRCRYKTGRCPNPRAVKANGTLLLLCEYHRSQQNRTKKRSDMKCRHDRAKKRQVQREKLIKRQQLSNCSGNNVGGWSSSIPPVASIIAPVGDAVAYEKSRKLEKSLASTSPTSVEFDVSSTSWTQPSSTLLTERNRLALEELWLLQYFLL
ncbi:uncharacterized protein PHALS_06209 [Plasmopara halstedii]|uniref:Uncharacterized protein n=1 Tax=Plasmopara halstedii TaxID=4781 RepID=A0A0P1B371_PLAHL|nr:uncharacterized protein PHALS_06209 [Plasmopara halstedii]CEG48384.1 hypothetical protein PHALS_06209 [Plasmopara halstedii]|eukprot:XP_024584753.1 hypothetical protein PHALS_06209 [Plasmopara halstedii]